MRVNKQTATLNVYMNFVNKMAGVQIHDFVS